MNTLRTFILLTLLTLFFVWTGGAMGGKSGMTFALFFAAIMNISAYWFSDKMVLAMYKAKEMPEAEAPELYSIVRRLVQRAGMPMPRVYMIDAGQAQCLCNWKKP